jgi:two-component system, NtrC family, sensor histidine kinase HydH
MRYQRWITLAVLLLAFTVLVIWQWDEYGYECNLAQETVSRSADSVMNALVGGISSHRRLGLFFSEQTQAVLDELVLSKDVLAVALVSEDGKGALFAGKHDLLNLSPPFTESESWEKAGFRLIKIFRLPSERAGPGAGRGSGTGGGQGMGRGPRWQTEVDNTQNPFAPGRKVAAILLVDRIRTDTAIRHAAWMRGSIVVAGWLVVLCVAWAWRASMRLAEARGHASMLEIEARHLRDLGQAAAGLAHETRNPLGLIRGWMQRFSESGTTSDNGRQQAQAVIEECDRVTARINQFLAFARPSEPKLEQLDPADMIDELGKILEPDLSAKALMLKRPVPGLTMKADREMLRQALFNLLQNAIQASPEKGTVEISVLRERDGRLRIEVSDSGLGVQEEAVKNLFAPYFTTRIGGTGLGLAIVRRIAAAHGWDAGYTPRLGGGSVFWLNGIYG